MSLLKVNLERFDSLRGDEKTDFSGTIDAYCEDGRAQAYAEGYAAGERDAHAAGAAHEVFLNDAALAISVELEKLPDRINQRLCKGVAIVVEKIFPALVEKCLIDEALAVMTKSGLFENCCRITVTCAPQHQSALEDAIRKLPNGPPLTVQGDANMQPGSVIANWDDAQFELDLKKSIDRCQSLLMAAAEQQVSER